MNTLMVDSVIHSFREKVLLNGIYLECTTGQVIGLLGRNGSGKSTLFKLIFGSQAVKGQMGIFINDKKRAIGLANRNISLLPQQSFLPNKKVEYIIHFFLRNKEAQSVLEISEINSIRSLNFKHLSQGEQRLLEILLILYSPSMFALLDEPFTGLSPLYQELVIKHIQIQKSSKGIIIADHEYENVLACSDQIGILINGCYKVLDGTCNIKEQLVQAGYLRHAFVN